MRYIVFDEVQFQPLARQAIKSFVDDRRYDYIETYTKGSDPFVYGTSYEVITKHFPSETVARSYHQTLPLRAVFVMMTPCPATGHHYKQKNNSKSLESELSDDSELFFSW